MTLRFGTDGVRGVANVDLTPELVVALGRAAARVLGAGPFVVGRDTRRSGPLLEAALASGLAAEGADVELLGVVPTPAVAFASQTHDVPGAVISASHNPFPDNGIKFFLPGGRKLTDEVERAIEQTLDGLLHGARSTDVPEGTGVGTIRAVPAAVTAYCEHVAASIQGRRLDGLTVALDCANGAASFVAPAGLEHLGAHVEVLHAAPDGTNINDRCGSTDPTDLQQVVVDRGAACGLAFDGDADRLIAVDERGGIVDGDHLLAICALDMRARGVLRHQAIAVTVMANLGLRRAMAAAGIEVVETPVGDRAVLEAIAQRGLSLGGEQSGHLIFADIASTGDGLLSAVILLDVLARRREPLSALAGVVERVPQVLRNVRVRQAGALDDAATFWKEVRAVEAELGAGGRVLVRPSGTEPVVRIMVEATDAAAAESAVGRLVTALTGALGDGSAGSEQSGRPGS